MSDQKQDNSVVWLPVTEFKEFYDVSNTGRVRRTMPAQGTTVGKILAVRKDHHGYPQVRLSGYPGQTAYRCVHALVAKAFLGPRPSLGHVVNHKNHIRDDNKVENLEWITYAENCVFGEQHVNSKLTEDDVRKIRKATGVTTVALAKQFSVSQPLISQLRRGIGWKHVA